jgi:hypothetical protein
MFIAKALKKMALPELTPQGHFFQGAFGEHCVNLATKVFPRNVLLFLKVKQMCKVFMRNAG